MNKIRNIAIGVFAIAVLGYFGGGYVVYDRLTKIPAVDTKTVENTPAGFKVTYDEYPDFDPSPYFVENYQVVSFPSRQAGIELSGWYMEADPAAPVVIVTHGLGDSKKDANVLVPAGMLVHNGFNVLMYDLRNHGDSDHDNGRTSVGNKEYLDVLGAWDWLVNVKAYSPQRVGLYGVSLGGGTTLDAFALEPRVAAAFVDSPFANLPEIITAELARNNYPTFLSGAAVIMDRVMTGEDLLAHSPTEAISKDAGRPLYIVHGTGDKRISVTQTEELSALAQESGANLTTWMPEGVGHVGSVFVHTDEYQERLVAFFKDALK